MDIDTVKKMDTEHNRKLEDIEHYPTDLKLDDMYKLTDLYFKQFNIMYSHLYNSFDKFIEYDIPNLLKNSDNIFYEKITKTKVIRNKFIFEDISIKPPTVDTTNKIIYPSTARKRNLTYRSKLVATVIQIQEVIDIATGEKNTRQIGEPEYEYPIAHVPIMVRSKYCSLNIQKNNKKECEFDRGGYFIVKGQEKVVITFERIIYNKPLIFTKQDGAVKLCTGLIYSKSPTSDMVQIHNLIMKKNNSIMIKMTFLSEVPVFILMRALGIESDRDIINYTIYNTEDIDMINVIRESLNNCVTEKGLKIITQEDAISYLITKMRVLKKYPYTETDKDTKILEKKLHLKSLLSESFLPHVTGGLINKGYYLGYMINKLILAHLKRVDIDDRDSFVNKRLDLPGTLLFDLFKQSFKKMLNECSKLFVKRNTDDDNPPVVINHIKPNIIEGTLKTALSIGTFGKKKGVAQMLNRLSYLQMIASLRRLNSPTTDASTNKLTGPRHLHGTQIGAACYIETPEGHKVGIVKNLSMIGNITIALDSQLELIKRKLINKIIKISEVPSNKIKDYTKVLLNGEWYGLTDKPRELYNELKRMKLNNEINNTTGISHEIKSEIECKELKIYCDSGRLYRPILRVENNKLVLTKEHINTISLEEYDSSVKITSWNEFMKKNPNVIEYLDTNEQFNSMLAMFPADVENMRLKQERSITLLKKTVVNNNNVINRYDEFVYVKYTHCEIHPALLTGCVVANIPFYNSNQGPRNVYQYSQAKHAMGICSTSYRDRLDITHILYHLQRPIVNTRLMKYIGTDCIPYGENAVVAILCYTGSNQEDSVIMNGAAINRGLYRSSSLKKFITTIQKNQSTSEDDVFIKPDLSKVAGRKPGSYDKLNEYGYAPKETEIITGDVIIGKLSPIQPMEGSDKIFKDSSEVYKEKIPGVIDKVWDKIQDNDGYDMIKIRTRSEREPVIGDKVCSRHGQKGTVGIILRQSDMPFTKDGITPDIIMNPHAIPSRMTCGQLIECLVGKISAIEGHETDGTAFRSIDLDNIRNELMKLGYEQNGQEYLYNGMTGRKLKSMVFIGPTYYQRLKHMVNDKIHSRARGPKTILTRQAPEGRSRDGGLRFGEMERDSIISHGMAKFLKERMMETADAYTTHVCDICGLFAQRLVRVGNKPYASDSDVYHCPSCKNKNKISTVRIPYAFKILIQELMAMNIAPRIRVKDSDLE